MNKRKPIARLIIIPADNGGHTVEHHFHPKHSKSGAHISIEEPEHHAFGPGEHEQMLAHIANNLNLPEPEEQEEREEGEGEEP